MFDGLLGNLGFDGRRGLRYDLRWLVDHDQIRRRLRFCLSRLGMLDGLILPSNGLEMFCRLIVHPCSFVTFFRVADITIVNIPDRVLIPIIVAMLPVEEMLPVVPV